MLDLAIGGDLALKLYDFLGPLVYAAQDLQPDGTEHDEKNHHRKKRHQQLGLYACRYAGNQANE